ncbi:plasma serine protease inhibitor [Dasypus novemcinctus]|uniref:plasma serine protease inhibitor n=1 Tax=Dasypus novemcinctus TaxID=9361 RepID=UPI0000E35A25|nr:plasma serine protease inhibitor [Dasypus novemcinctus]XP_004455969.1 plasma serine protease inhibitor [Dasypus novemcinctus]XP_004455970.1 plasma serine protease inhibitor [Dasypus novemcinctus]XP_058148106.1 plasma serine protease inhibitor [Dasypus novemcinctus]
MQPLLLLCLMLFSPLVATFGRHHRREMKTEVQEAHVDTTAAAKSRDFAFDLYRALAAAAPDRNIFFSPLSISTALAMVSLGARANTKAQILEALGLNLEETPEEEFHMGFQKLLQELSQPRDSLQLSLGNALFMDRKLDFEETFLSAVKKLYLADTFTTNFGDPTGALKQINDYVAKQTQGKIVDLLKDLEPTTIAVLVNYIFFKAKWKTSFSRQSTQERDFYVNSKTVVRVPMMNHEDLYYYLHDRNLSCRVVGVPYQGNATALLILPNEGKMEQVENGLNEKTLRKWLKIFRKRHLDLYFPKFSITGSYQLEKVLPKLGIHDIFSSHADLTGITNHSNIQISEMVHKAVVEVDESGTTAAATTGLVFMFRSAHLTAPRLVFDKPFLIIIKEDDRILFSGKIVYP